MEKQEEVKTHNIYDKLRLVQQELNAPKNQYNKFGGYAYRSCEDIYNAVKPLLAKYECTLTVTDELVKIGDRYYVKATAYFTDGHDGDVRYVYNTAYAREEETKKGTDSAQITGACSSYARKYCLNGLFLIDDVKDPDATNTHGKEAPKDEKKFENIEVEREQYMSFSDDFLFQHPELKDRIFTKYGLKEIRDIKKMNLADIDEMITGMKKVDAKAKEQTSIYGKEETF